MKKGLTTIGLVLFLATVHAGLADAATYNYWIKVPLNDAEIVGRENGKVVSTQVLPGAKPIWITVIQTPNAVYRCIEFADKEISANYVVDGDLNIENELCYRRENRK